MIMTMVGAEKMIRRLPHTRKAYLSLAGRAQIRECARPSLQMRVDRVSRHRLCVRDR